MKSFGEYVPKETVGIGFTRFAFPRGRELPRAPVPGEMFFLDADIDGKVDRLSFERGLYVSSGYDWVPYSETFAKRKAMPIGSQLIEVEIPGNMKRLPNMNEGFKLAEVVIRPEFRRTTISGTASFWCSTDVDATIVTSVWRGDKLITFAFEQLDAKKPKTVSISFLDGPTSTTNQVYTLKANTSVTGALYVNQSKQFIFDGLSQTAFIVAENN